MAGNLGPRPLQAFTVGAPTICDPICYVTNLRKMKKAFFKGILAINKYLLPKYSGKDPATLNKFQLAVLGFRYWVLKNSL